MAVLPSFPTQNFELIRDRIGEILTDELTNQSIDSVVYRERVTPFDKTDLECLNVSLAQGDYTSKTQIDTDGEYQYNIDIYVSKKTTETDAADKLANHRLQKLIGIVCYILRASQYRTLLFANPLISHTMVTNFRIADTVNQDATTTVMARVQFNVNCTEGSGLSDTIELDKNTTTVKLHETDKGYIWIKP